MKILFTTILTVILTSCGLSDYSEITMICNGKLHNMEYSLSGGKFNPVVLYDKTLGNNERVLRFNNKKYESYDCDWSDLMIVCQRKTDDGKYQTNFNLRLDRVTGHVSILDELEKNETKFVETYEGKCEKSQGKKI